MFAVLIILRPGHQNKFIDYQKAKVRIAVLPIMDIKRLWNLTLELLERASQFGEFTCKWLQNPTYCYSRPLFTTQAKRTIGKYIMDVLRLFRYWALWMSKWHSVTMHQVIIVYNDMFNNMDGVMQALAKKKTQSTEELFFAMNLAWPKLSKYSDELNSTKRILQISAHILDPFWMLVSSSKLDKRMNINPEDETSYTTQYREAILKNVKNEYCAKLRHVPGNTSDNVLSSNLVLTALASRCGQSCFELYDLFSNDEEYLMLNNVATMTPGPRNSAAYWFIATGVYLNSLPEAPMNWGQFNPSLNDYHSDRMEISSGFWIPDIPDWWCQQQGTHSEYTNLSNEVHNIYSIIPPGVELESSYFLECHDIDWRQSTTRSDTVREEVIVRQFAQANTGISARDDPAFDMTIQASNSEMMKLAEGRKLHRMAKGHHNGGDVTGQQKPTWYTEGISRSTQTDDSQRIHFGHRRDRESIPVTLSSWQRGCI